MRLSIVLVSFNSRAEILSCLDSIYPGDSSTRLESFEVIVADNDSTDGTTGAIAERFPQVRVIPCGGNLGFSRASNVGWQSARSPLVLFLNCDTVVPEGAIDRMVAILESRRDVGALGPKLRYEDGAVQISFGKMLSFTSEFLQKCWDAGYARGKGPLRSLVEKRSARERSVDWVSGACLLTRRDILETISGFDESFFLYSEDVDLCARIRATGALVLFTPEVEIVHLLGRSTRKERERSLLESQRSRLYFYAKHYGPARVGALRAYMTVKAALGYVLRPADRPLYKSVLELAIGGV
jgi:hypothetical protein